MARTVAGRGPYSDGTSPPVAFIHANNFFADEPRTGAYASVAFGREGRLDPVSIIEGEITAGGEAIRWLVAYFRIPFGDVDRGVEGR